MKNFYFSIVLCFVFNVYQVNSQCTQYNTANTSKTLSNNNVNVVVVDAQSVKWFGTEAGLSRFDDVSWKSFTTSDGLPNININDIVVDALNNKWIATDSGVSKFDGKVFTNYTEKNGLINNYVYHIAIDKKNVVWFATDGGVSAYDGKNWKSFTQQNGLGDRAITSITVDEKGLIWCTNPKGISVYNGTEWTNFTQDNSIITSYATSIYVDVKGNKWITTGDGLVKFDGLKWSKINIDEKFTDKFNRSLGADLKGNLWFCGWMKLFKFNGANWKEFTESDGLPCNIIYSMAAEKNGVLWFASLEGALKFDGLKWTRFTTTGGLAHNSIKTMLFDKQGVNWFGTLGGLSALNNNTWQQFSQVEGKTFEVYSLDTDSKNNKWLATNIGLLKYDGKSLTRIGKETKFKCIKVDKSDNIWLVAENYSYDDDEDIAPTNLQKFDGKEWTYTIFGDKDLYLGSASAYTFDIDASGKMWFGTLYDGVITYDGNHWKQYKAELNFRTINSIKVDKNNFVWIATSDGIVSYDNKDKWTNYDMNSGEFMDENSIYSVFIDSKGNKWFETAKSGVLKFDGDKWFKVNLPVCLNGKLIESLAVDPQENLWIGTDGLNKITSINLSAYQPEISDVVPSKTDSISTGLDTDYYDEGDDDITLSNNSKESKYSNNQFVINDVNNLCVKYDPYIRKFSFDEATNILKWVDKDGEIICTANINEIKIYNNKNGANCNVDFECKEGSACININTQGLKRVTSISVNNCDGADQIVKALNKIKGISTVSYPTPESVIANKTGLELVNDLCVKYDNYVRHFTFDKDSKVLTWVNKDGDIITKAKIGDITVHVMNGGNSYYVRFECIANGTKCIDCSYGGATNVSAITLNNKQAAMQIVDELVKIGFQRKNDE